MTIRDLIEELEGYDPEAEVRFMSQQSWPFEYSIYKVWAPPEPSAPACAICGYAVSGHSSMDYDHQVELDREDSFKPHGGVEAVYLVEGQQLGYGTKDAWD